ncbi:hypothetical protein [Streptomyces griseofuscus]|uniref:hypothetical protein n=1 Tax=Streptomyces griseofuscus TaxID=146922 RepID=UPI0033F3347E
MRQLVFAEPPAAAEASGGRTTPTAPAATASSAIRAYGHVILEIVGLDEVIGCHPTVDQALTA